MTLQWIASTALYEYNYAVSYLFRNINRLFGCALSLLYWIYTCDGCISAYKDGFWNCNLFLSVLVCWVCKGSRTQRTPSGDKHVLPLYFNDHAKGKKVQIFSL